MSVLPSRRLTLLLALGASLGLAACGGGGGSAGTPGNTDPNGWNAVTALKVTDTTVGTGAEAIAGKSVTVTYTGWLYDVRATDTRGLKFDSNVGAASGHKFTLGTNPTQVIKGFDQGVTGMKVGGKRTLTIPANLGYGSSGYLSVPPNAALVFDVELTAVN